MYLEQIKFEVYLILCLLLAVLLLPIAFTQRTGSNAIRSGIVYATDSEKVTRIKQPVSRPVDVSAAQSVRLDSNTSEASANVATRASVWPMNGRVTAEFGIPHWPWQRRHTGIDIQSGQHSNIVHAFKAGTVTEVVSISRGGYGKYIVVSHGKGLTSLYAHLSRISVSEGQTIQAGQALGREGRTGRTTGVHLHLEIRLRDVPVNPRKYISGNP
jgi:murein DD-endopeptidase MepM/ murein hydrolase activator NlpD